MAVLKSVRYSGPRKRKTATAANTILLNDICLPLGDVSVNRRDTKAAPGSNIECMDVERTQVEPKSVCIDEMIVP